MEKRKIIGIFGHLFWLIVLLALGIGLSFLFRIWQGYPVGSDFPSHIYRVEVIERFWPYHSWLPVWAGGMPIFLWYPSLLYLIVAFLHKITALSNGLLLSSVSVLALVVSGWGIYGLIWEATRQRVLAFVTAFLYLSTPSLWSIAFSAGLYSRGFALPFLTLTLFFAFRLVKQAAEGKFSKFDYLLTVFFFTGTLLAHFFVGPGLFILIGFLVFFFIRGFWLKIGWLAKIFLPAVFLSAYFTFPLILSPSPSLRIIRGHTTFEPRFMFASWADLINDGFLFVRDRKWDDLWSLSPFLLPLILILLILVLIFARRKLNFSTPSVKLFVSFLIISFFLLIYAKFNLHFKHYGSGVFDPRMALQYLPIVLAPLVGILWYLLFPQKGFWKLTSLIILIGLLFWLPKRFILNIDSYRFYPTPYSLNIPLDQILKRFLPGNQFNFRVGTGNYSSIASWFNSFYPYVPQTRDYLATSVVIPDDYFQLVQAGWMTNDNPKETDFLFDWWAVKQFFVYPSEEVDWKFSQNPNSYQSLDSSTDFKIYQFKSPSPILEATSVPSILIVGAKTSYDIIFRSLAMGDLNSRLFIPVRGPQYIDDLEPAEIKKFKALFLYDFKWRNLALAQKILKDYQKNGGAIFIEENKEGQKFSDLEISSIESVADVGFGMDWQLKTSEKGLKLLKNPNFKDFAPPIFEQGPWRMVELVKAGENVENLLLNYGRPVLAIEEKEGSRLVWSGLNFSYHVLNYRNQEEARILGALLGWLVKNEEVAPQPVVVPAETNDLTYKTAAFQATFVNPQKRVVSLSQAASGVLFKEAFFKNWHAYGDKGELKIYPAGPNFIYLPLTGNEKEISFIYRKSLFPEKFGYLLSLATLLVLIGYGLEGRLKVKIFSQLGKLFSRKAASVKDKGLAWWDVEE